MASNTNIVRTKRARRRKRMGRERKLRLSRKSTLSYSELFAACGEVGQPVATRR
jgi:hypothetical protein